MATLTVTTIHDYSGDTLTGITDIVFNTSATATATFASSQFDGTHISTSVNITGDAQINIIQVNMSATGTFSAAGWTLSSWSLNDSVIINGTSGADTITGSAEKDIITGGGGADSLSGGNGSDRFRYTAPSDIVAGETVDGGSGTDVIQVDAAGSYDFSGITLTSIEQLTYFAASTVTLAGTQVGTGKIATIFGDANANALIVNGASVDLSAVSFTSWTAGTDTITINGTAGGDTLTGSSQNDTINGSAGADTLSGGAGADTLSGGDNNDIFIYNAPGDIVLGETVDGGTGTDEIRVDAAGSYDFSGITLTSIETLKFNAASTVTLAGTQVGASQIAAIIGNLQVNSLIVTGASVDLSAVSFSGWTAGTDTVTINGTASGDTLTGSSQNDTITGGAGADTLSGGAGADTINGGLQNDHITGGSGADSLSGGDGQDTFIYTAPGDIVAGETVDGGIDTDFVQINAAGSYDFSGITLTSIEALVYAAASTVTLAGTQVGTGQIATIFGDGNANALIVNGASVDLSAVSFLSWTAGTDTISINGTSSADILKGSSQNDTINAGAGDDVLIGGAGADILSGSFGADTLTGSAGADTFVFDAAALADATAPLPIFDRITDYDQSGGTFSTGEGDQLDLSALLSTAFNHGSGQPIASLVRAVASGTGANLEIDPDGTANGANFVTIARLDGIHAGNQVNVILDQTQPAGTAITVQAPFATDDFSGDRNSDILWRNDDGTLATWDMNDHAYSGAVIAQVTNDWHIAGTGDFNGDGKTDILWRNDNGTLATWDMNDHAFSGFIFNPAVTNDWHIAGTGDFNGDGKTDILWRNDNGTLATWDMNDHAFSGFAFTPVVTNDWHVAGTGDFNGDGKTDILWRNDNGTLATWDMNDHAFSGFIFTPAVTNDWHVAGTGDFNGDGKTDILWRNDNGTLATWDMDDHAYGGAVIATVTNDWHIAGTEDFNGDGKTDILWRNDDGTLATWDMNDHAYSGAIIAQVTNDWHTFA